MVRKLQKAMGFAISGGGLVVLLSHLAMGYGS